MFKNVKLLVLESCLMLKHLGKSRSKLLVKHARTCSCKRSRTSGKNAYFILNDRREKKILRCQPKFGQPRIVFIFIFEVNILWGCVSSRNMLQLFIDTNFL